MLLNLFEEQYNFTDTQMYDKMLHPPTKFRSSLKTFSTFFMRSERSESVKNSNLHI